jgi:hypothetical protein
MKKSETIRMTKNEVGCLVRMEMDRRAKLKRQSRYDHGRLIRTGEVDLAMQPDGGALAIVEITQDVSDCG